jgi:hypothetical protein
MTRTVLAASRTLLVVALALACVACLHLGCAKRTTAGKAPPLRPAARPTSVPAPTKDRPVVLWRETDAAISDWRGDFRVAYERRPALTGETPRLALGIDLGASRPGKRHVLYAYVKQPLPEVTGYLDLTPALARLRTVLATDCPGLRGQSLLTVTVGAGQADNHTPLSNEVTIRCLFSPGPSPIANAS